MATINAINSNIPIEVTKGGTGAATFTANGLLIGQTTSAIAAMSAGSAGQIVTSSGVGVNPAWTTATYPATAAQGDVIYASSANTIAGLTKDTNATRYLANTGAGNNPAWDQVELTDGVSGILPIANGGTNASSMATTYGVNYFDGTRLVTTAVGTATHVLTSNGAGVAPTFQAASGGIGTLNGDAGSATGATVTIAGTANQISTSAAAATVTLSLTSSVTIANDFTQTNGDHNIGNTDAATTAPFSNFLKSRSGGVITSGDILGSVTFQGISTGTTYVTGASITCTSSGTIAANRVASNMVFATHPDSASGSTPTTRMTIASTGAVTIASPDSGVGLTVSGGGATITAGNLTVSSGLLALPTTSSTVGQVTINAAPYIHFYGTDNVFIGPSCGNFTLTTGGAGTAYNTAVGANSMSSVTTTAQFNAGFGRYTLNALTTGDLNTACGDESLAALTTGSRNTCIGYNSGGSLTTTDSNNICIGSETTGTAGNGNTLRIGSGAGTGNGQLNRAFIHGIRGITTGQADAIAVLVDSVGQLGTVSSSIRYKENIVDLEGSERLYDLRPVSFNYKTQPDRTSSGLIAEEVFDIYPELVAHNQEGEIESVKYHDLPVLLLNEIKKLRRRIEELERRP